MMRPRAAYGCLIGAAVSLVFLVAGCSTHSKRLMEPRSLYHQGAMEDCRVKLEKLTKNRQDRDVAKLDLAMVDLISGRPREAEALLREARDRLEFSNKNRWPKKPFQSGPTTSNVLWRRRLRADPCLCLPRTGEPHA